MLNQAMRKLSKLKKDESGATAIEYALIAAAISIVIIVVIGLVGEGLNETFSAIAAALGVGGDGS